MSDSPLLVNSTYPLSYFSLSGVSNISYPDTSWWSSKQRFASVDNTDSYLSQPNGGSPTTEYLEIDLGRVREINYINFDVLRVPVNISIEYDILSDVTQQIQEWIPVQAKVNQPFDDVVYFDGNNRSGWLNADFFFTDPKGNIVQTRFIRIGFSRRDEVWPLTTSAPFRWPVFVKHLRVVRNIATIDDATGPLILQTFSSDPVSSNLEIVSDTSTKEARQQFVYPSDAARGNIVPRITGFSVLVTVSDVNAAIQWSIFDVTGSPVLLLEGEEQGAVNTGKTWFDIYFDESNYIEGALDKVYEIRISSANPDLFDTIWTVAPNILSTTTIPGTLTFHGASDSIGTSMDTRSVVSIGDYIVKADVPSQPYLVNGISSSTITLNIPFMGTDATGTGLVVYPYSAWNDDAADYVADATQNLCVRVWSDVADDGEDVLGNTYRYGVREQKAENVIDNSKAGWMSSPVPTPEAVEALYFDARGTVDDVFVLSQIDAIRIAPRTPGVRMNIYYTKQGLNGNAPATVDDWDLLLWTPVAQQSYLLHRNEVINFPNPVNAAFMKLEFTALNPLPYNLPVTPPLPPKSYRRFPTWIEDQFNNTLVRTTISDWFIRNATPVQTQVLQTLTDPIKEFEYEQQAFLAALALGQITDAQTINSGIVDITDKALIDPTTASKIYLNNTTQYQNSLLVSVDQNSILGQVVSGQANPRVVLNPTETNFVSNIQNSIPVVSSTNDRVSEAYQSLAQTPMWFNTTCRHTYIEEEAEFNKKAFFVGIDSVEFLRIDYTVSRDDTLIIEDLFNDVLLESNTWAAEEATSIADGQTVYVSYSVNPSAVDEIVTLTGFDMVQLAITGGPAQKVLVFAAPQQRGIQYFQEVDYVLAYGTVNGERVTTIGRSPYGERLISPLETIVYVDAGIVIGHGVIPAPPTFDSGTVVGHGIPSADEGLLIPTYGLGVYGGGTGTYGALASLNLETGKVISVGKPTAIEGDVSTDAATVIGKGKPTGVDTYTP